MMAGNVSLSIVKNDENPQLTIIQVFVKFIGPIKSLWMDGYDEAIDDQGISIQNEVQLVAFGARTGYLVVRHFEQGKLPEYMMHQEMETVVLCLMINETLLSSRHKSLYCKAP